MKLYITQGTVPFVTTSISHTSLVSPVKSHFKQNPSQHIASGTDRRTRPQNAVKQYILTLHSKYSGLLTCEKVGLGVIGGAFAVNLLSVCILY